MSAVTHAYLTSAPVVRTHSLEEAREAVARVYLPHELTVGYLTYGAETELSMPATGDSYHVNLHS